jgi:hypothetical protein
MNRYEKNFFSKVVKKSTNLSDICRNLGLGTTKGNRDTVKKYIKKYDLDTSHFFVMRRNGIVKKKIEEILIENSSYTNTSNLKKRLYDSGLKKRICELCGQDEYWKGKKISLILDHINGINNDNRIKNLRVVCPNCNATLDTHGGKNKKNKYKCKKNKSNYGKKLNYCKCGEIISNKAKKCKKCDDINQRKVERPSYVQLIKEIENSNYLSVGKKYGVSDNAIRKWVKYYEKYASDA